MFAGGMRPGDQLGERRLLQRALLLDTHVKGHVMPSKKKITLRVRGVVEGEVIEIAGRKATEHFAVARAPNDAGKPDSWGWDVRHIRTGIPIPYRCDHAKEAHRLARAVEATNLPWDIDDPRKLQHGWNVAQRDILFKFICSAVKHTNPLLEGSIRSRLEFVNWEQIPPPADPANALLTATFVPR